MVDLQWKPHSDRQKPEYQQGIPQLKQSGYLCQKKPSKESHSTDCTYRLDNHIQDRKDLGWAMAIHCTDLDKVMPCIEDSDSSIRSMEMHMEAAKTPSIHMVLEDRRAEGNSEAMPQFGGRPEEYAVVKSE